MNNGGILQVLEIEQGSDEWLAERRKGVCGTDITAIMGESPFKTLQDLYKEKTEDDYQAPVNLEAVQWGKEHEREAIDLFCALKHKIYQGVGMVVSNTNQIFRCSPDGIVSGQSNEEELLEIKCPYNLILPETPPEYYVQQVQYGLFITGFKKGYLFYWVPDGHRLFEILPDKKLHKQMAKAAMTFWERHIIPRKAPPKDEAVDMSENDTWKNRVDEYRDASERLNSIKDELDRIKGELIDLAKGKKAKGYGLTLSPSWMSTKDYKGACERADLVVPEKEPSKRWTARLSNKQ